MVFFSVLTLAVGLAMDATAVAAARGLAVPRVELRHVLAVAAWFGGAQATMPVCGALLGQFAGPYVAAIDHWIAFVLLGGIGAKMLHEAWRSDSLETAPLPPRPFAPAVMLGLAIATSIDAFAAGLTLPALGAPFVLAGVVIGVVTALLSALGLMLGRRCGARVGRRLDGFGGLVLILLGTKVLIEHLAA